MPVELIMDGQMIRQNFKQKHLSQNWLMNELVSRSISDISEATYACLGTDQKL
ncbi:YetF domain-containing protein [Paenibacillus apii]